MGQKVKDFIDEVLAKFEDDINNDKFDLAYDYIANNYKDGWYNVVSTFTELLLDCGINPLKNTTQVFEGFLCSNKNINEVTIPANIRVIQECAFRHSNVKNIVFEEGSRLREIGNQAISACKLEQLILPEGLVVLRPFALYESKIDYLYIPKSLRVIGGFGLYTKVKKVKYGGSKEEFDILLENSHVDKKALSFSKNIIEFTN